MRWLRRLSRVGFDCLQSASSPHTPRINRHGYGIRRALTGAGLAMRAFPADERPFLTGHPGINLVARNHDRAQTPGSRRQDADPAFIMVVGLGITTPAANPHCKVASQDVNDWGLKYLELASVKVKPQQERWQHEILSHAPEYGAEFVGTVLLVFCVVAAVAVMFAPASPVLHLIPSARLRLFVTGSMLGGAGGLVAITPLGRISGAHLNPAISLGFFAEGKMQLQDLFGYIVAQLGGRCRGCMGRSSQCRRVWAVRTRGTESASERGVQLGGPRDSKCLPYSSIACQQPAPSPTASQVSRPKSVNSSVSSNAPQPY